MTGKLTETTFLFLDCFGDKPPRNDYKNNLKNNMKNKKILGWIMIAASAVMLLIAFPVAFAYFRFGSGMSGLASAFAGETDLYQTIWIVAATLFQAAYIAAIVLLAVYGKKFIKESKNAD